MKYITLEREVNAQKPYRAMYNDLIGVLENVGKYCAVRPAVKIQSRYPLNRFEIFTSIYDRSKIFTSHYENLYTAKILIHDYAVEECIHFELDTGEDRYRYQYSKKGLAIQTYARVLKEVTQMMTYTWFKKIHN